MKKLMLSIVATCCIAPVFAQKGSMLYYGGLGGTVDGTGPVHSAVFVNSGLGYQLNDHFTLGVQGGFSHYRFNDQGIGDVKSSSGYGAGVFGRYTSYLGSRFFVFAQANASYLSEPVGFARSGKGVGLNIFPGVGLNLGKSWALNLNMQAFSLYTNSDGGTSAGFNMGQGYTFGVSKGFGSKHKAQVEK